MPLFIIFIILPFFEILTFMAVGDEIGFFATLFLAFATAFLGVAIVKHQGIQTLLSLRTAQEQGKIPAGELFDGLCLVAAGTLLVVPGFLTDTVGFLLLVPAVRRMLLNMLKKHTTWVAEIHETRQDGALEGEFERLD